ncbi:isomerase [Deltaproteobacteria bacterium]|nr:isomerase [Deltaproteobacteria bacterium]
MSAKIERIVITHHQLPLDPPFLLAWDTRPRQKFPTTIVRVYDSDGRMGVGSGDVMYGFADFENLFLGQAADQLERHNAVLQNIDFHAGRPWPLEIALWDLVGRQRGTPCWRMAGGWNSEIQAYASSGVHRTPEATLDQAQRYLEEGFKALKLRFGRPELKDDLAVLARVAKGVGDKMKIMVDCNQGWRMPWDTNEAWGLRRAREVAKALEDHGVFWMEEPLARGDYQNMAALRREMKTLKIAGAELTREPYEFDQLLEHESLDIYQPDVAVTLGMSGLLKLVPKVAAKGCLFMPHTWGGGVGLLANAHITAGVTPPEKFDQVFLEYPHDPPEWTKERRDFIFLKPVALEPGGRLRLSEAPGLGLELDEDRLKATLSDRQTYA